MNNKGEKLARKFHDTYERLAPNFGYETREDTKQFDPTTSNGRLMIAVCTELAGDVASRETSAQVSNLAASWVDITGDEIRANLNNDDYIDALADTLQTLARSAILQDQTPGQEEPKGDFYSRLKDEREDLERRLIALNTYLSNNPGRPNPRHAKMLEEQSKLMSDLLAVLDERICDIDISKRSEISDGE